MVLPDAQVLRPVPRLVVLQGFLQEVRFERRDVAQQMALLFSVPAQAFFASFLVVPRKPELRSPVVILGSQTLFTEHSLLPCLNLLDFLVLEVRPFRRTVCIPAVLFATL